MATEALSSGRLYGRDAERARVGALLEAAQASRSGALVIRGEPGVGKTALLEEARAQAEGMRVLDARGLESESELAFAGLHQMLRPALRLVGELPGPQASALRGAFGLEERSGEDRFLVSVACLSLLSELAEEGPVLCLLDDAHWLDAPSADALVFVARRLGAEGVAMVFAAREGESRRFEAGGLPELRLGELDAASSASLLESRVGGSLDGGVRELLLERARGNPLALVELPGALSAPQLAGSEPLPAELPVTRAVEQLFHARVRQLPEATQQLLLLLAADGAGEFAPVLRAAEALGLPEHAIDEAEHAELVSVQGATLSFRHPLVRSAIYQSTPWKERRAAHLALAEALGGELEVDRRAWHRAAASRGPDPEIARELEASAERARLRSGPAAAATALERAAELSTDAESKARRLVAAADAAWHAGEPDRVLALLRRSEPFLRDARLRADVGHLRGLVGLRRGALLDAGTLLVSAAADVAPFEPAKAFEMCVDAGSVAGRSGNFALMGEASRLVEKLPRSDDESESLLADLLVGVGGLIEGKSAEQAALVAEAVVRAASFDDPRLLSWAATGASVIGDEAAEAALLRRAVAVARASGAVDTLVLVLETVVSSAVVSGRVVSVDAEVSEGLALAEETALENAAQSFRAVRAWTAAVRGSDQECLSDAAFVISANRTSGLANANTIAEWGVAMLDLVRGRPEETARRLTALRSAAPGVLQPFYVLLFTPDLVEAYVRSNRLEEAREAAAFLDAFAQPGAPTWAFPYAARCRALVAGNDESEAAFAHAVRLHNAGSRRFDGARTQLLFGEYLRRRRRRRDAREHLRAALETFEALGAEPWAERARAELRASGETARKRDPSTVDRLTPQELQIARFVAEGLSNKEVAAQLFLSPRTIDYHLRNVFQKLGITSRTQLARLPLGADATAAAAHA